MTRRAERRELNVLHRVKTASNSRIRGLQKIITKWQLCTSKKEMNGAGPEGFVRLNIRAREGLPFVSTVVLAKVEPECSPSCNIRSVEC